MTYEIIRASLLCGLPLMIISYILVGRAIQSKRLGDFDDTKTLESASRKMAKQHKQDIKQKNKANKNQVVLNKWMSFGGGFYGLMALITYAYIELKEIADFSQKTFALSWDQFFSSISFDLLVNLIVNSIKNLVDAFVWFHFWPKVILINNGWVWLIAAYIGYSLGAQIAKYFPPHTLLAHFKNKTQDKH